MEVDDNKMDIDYELSTNYNSIQLKQIKHLDNKIIKLNKLKNKLEQQLKIQQQQHQCQNQHYQSQLQTQQQRLNEINAQITLKQTK